MTDCPNAEIRDRLPDLLHDRLDPSTRAAIMAHVVGCDDCREELELLRGVRKALVAGTPRVNISEIVYALPKPGASPKSTIRRMPRVDWRLAAAVTLLVAGASSLTVLSKGSNRSPNQIDTTALAVAPQIAPSAVPSTHTESTTKAPVTNVTPNAPVATPQAPSATEAVASTSEPADAAASAQLSGLNARQLKALLNDIDQMQAVPVSDPEPVAIRVDAKPSPSGAEER